MRWLALIAVLLAVLLAGCGKQEVAATPCPALARGCAVAFDAEKITVKTNIEPVPLQPFALTVAAPAAHDVSVALQMQGMEMGLNRYRLVRDPSGEWRATITLPVCVSGRRDWLMILEVDGARRALAFQTPGN